LPESPETNEEENGGLTLKHPFTFEREEETSKIKFSTERKGPPEEAIAEEMMKIHDVPGGHGRNVKKKVDC